MSVRITHVHVALLLAFHLMNTPQFIHSPVNRHLDYSQSCVIMKKKVAMNIVVCIFWWIHHILR